MTNLKVKRTSILILRICIISILIITTGCYPDQPERVEEYDVAYTNYSTEFDFGPARTYSLPDRVVLIDDENFDDGEEPEYLDDLFSSTILDGIRGNMNSIGWTEVSEDASPEIVILPSAFDQTFLYYYDIGYWDWYYPGFFPGWGWYYPYSPGYVSGYTTGTVLVQMTIPSEAEGQEVPVIWVGALNGLLEGSDRNISERISTNLDQAFSQPPFNN